MITETKGKKIETIFLEVGLHDDILCFNESFIIYRRSLKELEKYSYLVSQQPDSYFQTLISKNLRKTKKTKKQKKNNNNNIKSL